jgi:hypothetical protein
MVIETCSDPREGRHTNDVEAMDPLIGSIPAVDPVSRARVNLPAGGVAEASDPT